MTKIVELDLNKDVTIQIEGIHKDYWIGSYEQPPEPEEFEIEEITLSKGNLWEYTDYINSIVVKGIDIWVHLEELCLLKLQEGK